MKFGVDPTGHDAERDIFGSGTTLAFVGGRGGTTPHGAGAAGLVVFSMGLPASTRFCIGFLTALLGVALLAGCADHFSALSPVPITLPAGQAGIAAAHYASLRPGAFVVKGLGKGMMPLYAPDTILVVEPVPYRTLREGMTVLYQNRYGRYVHYLEREGPGGWVTLGVNQSREDPKPMAREDFLGRVVMAFGPPPVPKGHVIVGAPYLRSTPP